jgi:hypothetical protein
MPATALLLMGSEIQLWTVDCGLWTVGCGLWTVDCRLWAVGFGLWAVGCGLWGGHRNLNRGLATNVRKPALKTQSRGNKTLDFGNYMYPRIPSFYYKRASRHCISKSMGFLGSPRAL